MPTSPRRVVFDKVTAVFEEHAHARLGSIWTEVRRDSSRFLTPRKTDGPLQDDPFSVREDNRAITKRVAELCGRHNVFEFLLLVRKVPSSMLPYLLTGSATNLPFGKSGDRAVFHEAVLFATNCALVYCPNTMRVKAVNERNHFSPTSEMMDDAISVMIYAAWRSLNAFFLNSMARKEGEDLQSFAALLEIYNARMEKERAVEISVDEGDQILGLASRRHVLPNHDYMDAHWSGAPGAVRLSIANYLPIPTNSARSRFQFEYLNCRPFHDLFGVQFNDFWNSWLILNKLVQFTIPDWAPGQMFVVDGTRKQMQLERFFDICESGLGGGWLSEIKDNAFESCTAAFPHLTTTKAAFQATIDLATWNGNMPEGPGFIEQPYLFYRVGPDAAYWDYLRHGGFVKALARRALRSSGEFGDRKGFVLEREILSALSGISKVAVVGRDVVLGTAAAHDMEIDLLVVVEEIAFAIEAKSYVKSPKYYLADEREVDERTRRISDTLRDRDERLARLSGALRSLIPMRCVGVIAVVVTSEAEFVGSFEPWLWLVNRSVPRACLLAEFVSFLGSDLGETLRSHPAFISFSP